MPTNTPLFPYSPFHSPVMKIGAQMQPDGKREPKPPRRPDWLLILIAILVMLVLIILWFVDIPSLLW